MRLPTLTSLPYGAKKRTPIAAHEGKRSPKPTENAEESTLIFDESKAPVDVVEMPNPEIAQLRPEAFEVIGEKETSARKAPGQLCHSQVSKPNDQAPRHLGHICPAAPAEESQGSRANMSLIAGILIEVLYSSFPNCISENPYARGSGTIRRTLATTSHLFHFNRVPCSKRRANGRACSVRCLPTADRTRYEIS